MSSTAEASPPLRKTQLAWERRRAREEAEARALVMRRLVAGHSHADIADEFDVDVTTVRRWVKKELAEREPLPAQSHAGLQIARLERAVRSFESALDAGEWRAAVALPKVLAALDRYHRFAEAYSSTEATMRRLEGAGAPDALAAPLAQLPAAESVNSGDSGTKEQATR